MKILVDMNLPRSWVSYLQAQGHEVQHWSDLGAPTASDAEIMKWAREQQYVVFTHDLDFSALLALTRQTGPSVLQIRTQKIIPGSVGTLILAVLRQEQDHFERGALVSVDETTSRVRILPIK